MNRFGWAQIRAVIRLEMKKTFFARARTVDLSAGACARWRCFSPIRWSKFTCAACGSRWRSRQPGH